MALQENSVATLIAIAATAIILTIATSAVLSPNQNTTMDGTMSAVNVSIFNDSACTTDCTSISIGDMSPGTSKTYTFYVKNTGTVPVTLSMAPSDWNPTSANGPITLTWNRENYSLEAGASIDATLTLAVSQSISMNVTAFSLNVAITGIEYNV